MIIESVLLNEQRKKPSFKPIEPILLKNIEEYVTNCFNTLLKENNFIFNTFEDLFNNGFEGVVFGGWVRDRVVEFFTGNKIKSKDIDFVCKSKKNNDLSSYFSKDPMADKNMFGGFFIEHSTMHIDIWEVRNTYLIKKNFLKNEFKSLLLTADYTINSIIYHPKQNKSDAYLLDFGCVDSIKNNKIDFLANEVAFPIVQAARAVIFSARFNLTLSQTIIDFIKKICADDDNVKKIQSGIKKFCPPEYKSNAETIISNINKIIR